MMNTRESTMAVNPFVTSISSDFKSVPNKGRPMHLWKSSANGIPNMPNFNFSMRN